MDSIYVQQIVSRHNRMAVLKFFGLATLSAVLWPLCYFFFYYSAVAMTYPWNLVWSGFTYSAIAAACLLVLGVEGVFYKKKLFDLEDYKQSIYFDCVGHSSREFATTYLFGDTASSTFIIANLLFSAPRCSVLAWQAARSLVRADRDTTKAAHSIAEKLRAHNDWAPVTEFVESPGALALLDRLKILWLRVSEGTAQVRLSPRYRFK